MTSPSQPDKPEGIKNMRKWLGLPEHDQPKENKQTPCFNKEPQSEIRQANRVDIEGDIGPKKDDIDDTKLAKVLLETVGPRCKTKDTDDFPELEDSEGRCLTCRVWEAYDTARSEGYQTGYIAGQYDARSDMKTTRSDWVKEVEQLVEKSVYFKLNKTALDEVKQLLRRMA